MDRVEFDHCWTKILTGSGRTGCCSGTLQTQASNNNRRNTGRKPTWREKRRTPT